MKIEKLWQNNALNKVINIFKSYHEVKALILKGSLAGENVEVDQWSDVDLIVIIEDGKINSFGEDLDWIKQLGELFGLEKHNGAHYCTLRVCLDSFERFDFILIETSFVKEHLDAFKCPVKILFSSIDNLNSIIQVNQEDKYKIMPPNEFNDFCNSFWFRCTMVVTKAMRRDYLISSHLALELAQDCIVLQMLIRDCEKGTNIHRYGEGEKVEVLGFIDELNSSFDPSMCIKFVEKCGKLFDALALKYYSEYTVRSEVFNVWVDGVNFAILEAQE